MVEAKITEPTRYKEIQSAIKMAANEEIIRIRQTTEMRSTIVLNDNSTVQHNFYEVRLGGLGRRLYGFRMMFRGFSFRDSEDPLLNDFEIDYRFMGAKRVRNYMDNLGRKIGADIILETQLPAT